MKLYHSTKTKNVKSILCKGLIPGGLNRLGFIVYLAPTLESVNKDPRNTILEVETDDLRLSAFEDCRDWEVLCWGTIPPENIKIVKVNNNEISCLEKD